MRPPSRRLAPQSQNRQAAPPRPSDGGVRGPGAPFLTPPPTGPRADEGRPERQRPRIPRGGRCTQGGEHGGHGKRSRAPSAPGRLPARPRNTRNRPTTERRHPGKCRRTDPSAADRAAPDAHGRPAIPTAGVYPRGVRRRQRMTGAGATGHPTGQGGGEQQTGPAACGPVGGVGGVVPRPPCSPSGGRPAVLYPAPLSSPAHPPPWRARSVGVAGRPCAPAAACLVTPVTPALLPAQGRQRDGTRQSNPPPHWPPRPNKRGARRTPPPPHSPFPGTGTPQTCRPSPRGAHNPRAR